MGTAEGRDFEEIWRPRRDHLLRVAFLLCGDDHLADDVVAAAAARAWRGWDARRVRDPDAYLRRAVVNEATDRFRARSRYRRWAQRRTGEGRGALATDDAVAAADEVATALATLPVGQRAVVVLRFWVDLTEAATAETLGIGLGTVKSRTSRALATLAQLLDDDDRSGRHPATPGTPRGATRRA